MDKMLATTRTLFYLVLWASLVLTCGSSYAAFGPKECAAQLQETKITKSGYEGLRKSSGELSDGVPDSYDSLKTAAGLDLTNNSLSATDKKSLAFWIDSQKFPATTMDNLKMFGKYMKGIPRMDYVLCGTCKKMLPFHLRALVMPILNLKGELSDADYHRIEARPAITGGKFVLVRLNGILVGSVKVLGGESYRINSKGYFEHLEGELKSAISTPTFLAFRNVVNSKGETTLAMGGVYYITQELYQDVILPAVNAQGPYQSDIIGKDGWPNGTVHKFLNDFQVGVVDVDQLTLKPETFLFSAFGVDYAPNLEMMNTLFPETPSDNKVERLHSRWQVFLKTLESVRETLEAAGAKDPTYSELRSQLRAKYPRINIEKYREFEL